MKTRYDTINSDLVDIPIAPAAGKVSSMASSALELKRSSMSMESSSPGLDKSPLTAVRRRTTFARIETKSDGYGDVSMFDVKPNKNLIKPKKMPADEF